MGGKYYLTVLLIACLSSLPVLCGEQELDSEEEAKKAILGLQSRPDKTDKTFPFPDDEKIENSQILKDEQLQNQRELQTGAGNHNSVLAENIDTVSALANETLDLNQEKQQSEDLNKGNATEERGRGDGLVVDAENKSINETVANSTLKWNCSKMAALENGSSIIFIKNETQLLEFISESNSSQSCFLLYFYLNWCEFCSKMSVLVNAISRVFNGFPVLVVDAYSLTSITGRFGITGVPSLLLFYNGRPVARFNGTRSLQNFNSFMVEFTGLTSMENISIVDDDYNGPLPTKIEKKSDFYLLLSFLCLLLILIINTLRAEVSQNYIKSTINKFKAWAIRPKEE